MLSSIKIKQIKVTIRGGNEGYCLLPALTFLTPIFFSVFLLFSIQANATLTKWKGSTSTNWSTSSNWDNGVPSSSKNVWIPTLSSGTIRYPVISSSVACIDLQIDADASLIITTGGVLQINGNLTNNGSFDAGSQTVTFGGTTTISADITLTNVQISGTLTAPAGGNFNVNGTWTNNGTFIHNDGAVNFTGITTISGTSITTFNHVFISGTLTAHATNMRLDGSWSNNGVFNHNNGKVTFYGIWNQSIGGGTPSTFYNLEIDNSIYGATLDNSQTVENILTLSNGYLNLFTNMLTLNNSSTAAISRVNGYVISETIPVSGYSNLKWKVANNVGTYSFPFATNEGSLIPFTFQVTTAGTGNGYISVATYSTDDVNEPYPTGVSNMFNGSSIDISVQATNRFWLIAASAYTTNPTATITFQATATEVGSNTNLKAQKWNSSFWDEPTSGQTNTAVSVTTPSVSSFGQWIIAGSGSTGLPVTLTDFIARAENNTVVLNWNTFSEINNNYFTIERSADGKYFTEVAKIKGAGNSDSKEQYHAIDNSPLNGISYYRLKQTDFNGQYKHSELKSVNMVASNEFSIYPNPFVPKNNAQLNIQFKNNSETSGQIIITVFDLLGKQVMLSEQSVNETGVYHLDFNGNINKLESGTYFVKTTTDISTQKLVVIK